MNPLSRLRRKAPETAEVPSGAPLSAPGGETSAPAPKMAVVIPAYNVEDYIEECLRSVLDQSLRRIEVIVVDDGSTDRTGEILQAIAREDDRLRVLTQPNAGQGAARNHGVAQVTAPFLTFVDADDALPQHALRRQLRLLRRTGSDFTVGNILRTRNGSRTAPPWWAPVVHRRTRHGVTIDEFPEAMLDVIACNRVFRTEFWREKVGGFPEGVAYEDHAPMVIAYVRAARFDVLTGFTYAWRQREDHTSTSQSKDNMENLRDRLAAKRDAWAVLSTEASPQVIDQWLSRVLDVDLSLFIASALRADDDYRAVLQEAIADYLHRASDDAVRQVRLTFRLQLWLASEGRWDLVERLLEWQRDVGAMPATVVGGSEVLIDESVNEVLGIEVPERLRVLGSRETQAVLVMTGAHWASATELEIAGIAAIAHVDLQRYGRPEIRVVARNAAGQTHPFTVTVATDLPFSPQQATSQADYTPGGFRARIDLEPLAGEPGQWTVDFEVTVAGLTRTGQAFSSLHGSSASSLRLLERELHGHQVRPVWDPSDGLCILTEAIEVSEPGEEEPTTPPSPITVLAAEGTADTVVVTARLSGISVEDLRTQARFGDARASYPVTSVDQRAEGTVAITLPALVRPFGGPEVALPPGTYALSVGSASATLDASCEPPCDVRTALHGWRLMRGGGDTALFHLQPPLLADERGRYHQQQLRAWHRDLETTPEDAVYFQCYRGEFANDSQLALHHYLRAHRPDLTLYWGVEGHNTALPEGAQPLLIGSREWYRRLASVRYLSNNIDFDRYFTKRPFQKVLATFHGYPFKSMGRTFWEGRRYTPGRIEVEVARRNATWDAILVPSAPCEAMYRTEYDYEGPVLVTGYPRNDILVTADAPAHRAKVLAQLGVPSEATVVLYAPTYRDVLTTRTFAAKRFDDLDLAAFTERLGPDHVVLLRGHNNNQRELDRVRELPGVVDVTDYPDINDLILAADVALLDYSSLRFDWAITGKPMIFYVPDLEDYFSGRPPLFAYDDTTPGPRVVTLEETVAAVQSLEDVRRDYAQAIADFNAEFNALHDGHATERVAAFFSD